MQRFLVGSRDTSHCDIIPLLGCPHNDGVNRTAPGAQVSLDRPS